MRAIKLILLFILISPFASATDEYWGIYQFKKDLNQSHFLFFEYVRRDQDQFFENKFLDLYRFSYAGKIKGWTYLIGGAYVDFAKTSDERRLHQFLINQFQLTQSLSSLVRFGFEERSFISDSNIYIRARARAQLNLPIYGSWGLAAYDEILIPLNGENKYFQGLNENRFGTGLRFKSEKLEVLLYHTQAFVKSLRTETYPQWIQLQTIYLF